MKIRKLLTLPPLLSIRWGGSRHTYTVAPNLADAAASIRRLRDGAKEVIGYGYSIEWEERNSRRHGRNRFPRRIYFESESDFLRVIGKQKAFNAFSTAVQQIRTRRPELERWIRSNRQATVDAAGAIDGMLEVVDYLCAHPRPNCFARELPLMVDTKFVERNQNILREWLDILLSPTAIVAHEEHFARRFGLKYAEPHVHIRFLDPAIQQAANVRWSNCSVPLHLLADTHIEAKNAMVVENKTNLLTLPPLEATVGIGGMGYGVTDLRYLPWLRACHLWYWGDIDVDGFCILPRFRSVFPDAQSFLMDDHTVKHWADSMGGLGNCLSGVPLMNLTPAEQAAYQHCMDTNLRIEQERLPHSVVVDAIAALM